MRYDGELDLEFLADLDHLEELVVSHAPLAIHGLDALPRLKGLRELGLGGPAVRDEHMAVVAKTPQLRVFSFGWSNLTRAGQAEFENLHGLQSLQLSGTGLDDAFLSHISRLDNLTALRARPRERYRRRSEVD